MANIVQREVLLTKGPRFVKQNLITTHSSLERGGTVGTRWNGWNAVERHNEMTPKDSEVNDLPRLSSLFHELEVVGIFPNK